MKTDQNGRKWMKHKIFSSSKTISRDKPTVAINKPVIILDVL